MDQGGAGIETSGDKARYTPLSLTVDLESSGGERPGVSMSSSKTHPQTDNDQNDQVDSRAGLYTSASPVPDHPTEFDKKLFTPMLKSNQYQVRKSAVRSLMDAALMMANISQLRTIIELGPDRTEHFYVLLSLTIFSLVCQVIFAIIMFVIIMRESEMAQKKDYLEHLQMLETKGLPKEAADKMKAAISKQREDYEFGLYTTRLNYVTLILVFIVTVVNMFITGFGVRNKE